MALITSTTIIRSLALLHLTLAYFLLTSPSTLLNQNLVWIFGTAMDLPPPTSLSLPTPSTALTAVMLALLALSDLTASSLPEEISTFYWGSQSPVRLLFFVLTTGYSYVFAQSGGAVRKASGTGAGLGGVGGRVGRGWLGGKGERWGGDELKNSLVFTWGFVEMLCWFWVYVTLRDERREIVAKRMEKRKAEEDRL